MKSLRFVTLLCLCSFVFGVTASAAEGWKMPNLNPFKKTSTKRTTASISDHASRGRFPKTSMPSWPLPTTKPRPRKSPSTLEKMNRGTKQLWGKTKSVLMPWNKTSKRPVTRSSKKSKKFFFSSWFTKKEEPKRPQTVRDFLGLKRPY